MHESDVELGAHIALLGKQRQPLKRRGVIATMRRGYGVVEFGCRRRSNEAENQDKEHESCVDHVHCDRRQATRSRWRPYDRQAGSSFARRDSQF
jgi:hypothetical protein